MGHGVLSWEKAWWRGRGIMDVRSVVQVGSAWKSERDATFVYDYIWLYLFAAALPGLAGSWPEGLREGLLTSILNEE